MCVDLDSKEKIYASSIRLSSTVVDKKVFPIQCRIWSSSVHWAL